MLTSSFTPIRPPLAETPARRARFIQFINEHYSLTCLACGSKVVDPDKKKGQTHFTGDCPSCGKSSRKLSKRERRRAKLELANAVRHLTNNSLK